MSASEHAAEDTVMAIENNFVEVLPAVLIDPVLKLSLELGRWNPESSARGGTQDIHLSYDPELRPGRLTMPIPPQERKLLEILGPLKQNWTVFRSAESRRIADIIVDIHDRSDEVRLEFRPPRPSIAVDAELLARQGIDGISDRPYELLSYMFQSIVLMPNWAETYAIPWGKSTVSFCTATEIADELAAHTGAPFEKRGDGLAMIAARQVLS